MNCCYLGKCDILFHSNRCTIAEQTYMTKWWKDLVTNKQWPFLDKYMDSLSPNSCCVTVKQTCENELSPWDIHERHHLSRTAWPPRPMQPDGNNSGAQTLSANSGVTSDVEMRSRRQMICGVTSVHHSQARCVHCPRGAQQNQRPRRSHCSKRHGWGFARVVAMWRCVLHISSILSFELEVNDIFPPSEEPCWIIWADGDSPHSSLLLLLGTSCAETRVSTHIFSLAWILLLLINKLTTLVLAWSLDRCKETCIWRFGWEYFYHLSWLNIRLKDQDHGSGENS